MNDDETTVAQLKELVLRFSRERNWEQFHHPKDLGVALSCEVGELLEHFRYRKDEEVRTLLENDSKRREIAHELADCLWLILRLAEVCKIDLARVARREGETGGDQVSRRPFLRPERQVHRVSPAGPWQRGGRLRNYVSLQPNSEIHRGVRGDRGDRRRESP